MTPEHAPARVATERRAAAQNRLRALVGERTRTLALFSEVAAMRPFKRGRAVQRALRDFCQALVDYTASGHFLMYRFLADGGERRACLAALGRTLYPRIMVTTDRIVRFNDAYTRGSSQADLRNLADDLSELGEVLADRIVLEDRLIEAYLSER